MDVEPVRSGGRAYGVAIVVPVLVLVGVIGIALVGRGEPPANASPRPSSVGAASSTPSAIPSPIATAPPSARPSSVPFRPFPTEVAGIPVDAIGLASALGRSVPEDRLIAVGGWLSLAPLGEDCLDGLGAPGWRVYCPRLALLYDAAGSPAEALRVELQPGLTLPETTFRTDSPAPWSVTIPAVVIGHFTDRRARGCDLRPPRCEPILTIERVAWWDGEPMGRQVAVGPGGGPPSASAVGIDEAALPAIRGAAETLNVTVIGGAALEALHPEAGSTVPDEAPVWYVRAITWRHTQGGSYEPAVGWVVLDPATLAVLGAQPAGQSTGAS